MVAWHRMGNCKCNLTNTHFDDGIDQIDCKAESVLRTLCGDGEASFSKITKKRYRQPQVAEIDRTEFARTANAIPAPRSGRGAKEAPAALHPISVRGLVPRAVGAEALHRLGDLGVG